MASGFIDRRSIFNFDWFLLFLLFCLSGAGLYTVHCAVNGGPLEHLFWKQLTWTSLGFAVMFIVIIIDYTLLSKFAYVFYGFTIAMLIMVSLIHSNQGSDVHRWLKIGFLPQIQPSEFVKAAIIMVLAQYFHRLNKYKLNLKDLIIPAIFVVIPFFLVVSQPDLGTALSFIPICIVLFFIAGFPFKKMVIIGLLFLIPSILTAKYILKPYQIKRLTTFINPQEDIQGAGWHAVMSQISVGSGGVIGKTGNETRLYQRGFLPEQHTDFIFSVWAEETGFFGSIFIVILFILFLQRGIFIAMEAKEPLGVYLSVGIITIIGFQAFYNMGMVTGIFPITGLPLPFFSYGGSHQVMTFTLCGLLLNIRMRRYLF